MKQSSRSLILAPPPKKIKIIKALKPILGRGNLIPNESLFWCQVSRVHPHDFHYRQPEKPCFQRAPVGWNSGSTNAFEPRGFLGLMFPNWGEGKWCGNWKNDHRIGEGFYVYTLVSYTCSTGVLYQALSQHETSKGHLRLEMLMSETAW